MTDEETSSVARLRARDLILQNERERRQGNFQIRQEIFRAAVSLYANPPRDSSPLIDPPEEMKITVAVTRAIQLWKETDKQAGSHTNKLFHEVPALTPDS